MENFGWELIREFAEGLFPIWIHFQRNRCSPDKAEGERFPLSNDASNQLTKQTRQMGDTSYSETFTYGKANGLLATHTPAVGNKLTFGYGRLTGVTGGRQRDYRCVLSSL